MRQANCAGSWTLRPNRITPEGGKALKSAASSGDRARPAMPTMAAAAG